MGYTSYDWLYRRLQHCSNLDWRASAECQLEFQILKLMVSTRTPRRLCAISWYRLFRPWTHWGGTVGERNSLDGEILYKEESRKDTGRRHCRVILWEHHLQVILASFPNGLWEKEINRIGMRRMNINKGMAIWEIIDAYTIFSRNDTFPSRQICATIRFLRWFCLSGDRKSWFSRYNKVEGMLLSPLLSLC